MPNKRKKAVVAKPRKKIKSPTAAELQKELYFIPNEVLTNIFWRLDIVTAAVFGLVDHRCNEIYRDLAPQKFRPLDGYSLPIAIDTFIPLQEGGPLRLASALQTWMPKHLLWDFTINKFVTPERHKISMEEYIEDVEVRREDKKQARLERHRKFYADKEERQEAREERKRMRRQNKLDTREYLYNLALEDRRDRRAHEGNIDREDKGEFVEDEDDFDFDDFSGEDDLGSDDFETDSATSSELTYGTSVSSTGELL